MHICWKNCDSANELELADFRYHNTLVRDFASMNYDNDTS